MNKQKIHVLHILKNMQVGGVEQFLLNLYKVMSDSNIVFDFCLYGPDKKLNNQKLLKDFKELGSTIYYLPYPNKHFFSFQKEFRKLLLDNQIDCVHCHQNSFSGVILPIAKHANIPIRIAHAHTIEDRKGNSLFRKIYRKLMELSIAHSSTHLLGASKEANQYVFGQNNEAVEVKNGINLKRFIEANPRNLREELGISQNEILFGHVGTFNPIKNQEFLLKVFSRFYNKYHTGHLIFVGDGKTKQKIQNKVEQSIYKKRIHFLGIREDIPEILKETDLFLFPSYFEGLGMAVIEAQAAGLPCIISDNLPSSIDVECQLIYRQSIDDVDRWVELCGKYNWKELRERNSQKIVETFYRNKFDIHSTSEQLSKIYWNNE